MLRSLLLPPRKVAHISIHVAVHYSLWYASTRSRCAKHPHARYNTGCVATSRYPGGGIRGSDIPWEYVVIELHECCTTEM